MLFPTLLLAALPQAAAVEIPHEHYTLDNGLEVLLVPDDRLPKVAVDIWYDVGSYDDPEGRSGFAHLFEHLMFKGTPRVPEGQFDQRMEAVGGDNNATTSDDRTNYYEQGPSRALELLLWLEADRMMGLDLTQDKLDVEREVVRNERRQNYEDAPYGEVWLELPKMLYPESHPLHRSGIGTHDELMAASVEDVTSFYETWYVPSNAVLAVAGDFDVAKTRDWIARTFGTLPERPEPERTVVPQPERAVEPLKTLEDDVALPATYLAWHTPPFFAPGDAELDVLSALLTGAEDARLTRRLVHEEQLVQEIDAFQYSGRWGSWFLVIAHANPDADLARIEAVVDEELAGVIGNSPPTADELERAVNNIEMSKLYAAEGLLSRIDQMQSYYMHTGVFDGFDRDLARYEAVTPEAVAAQAAKLAPDTRATLRVVPRGAE